MGPFVFCQHLDRASGARSSPAAPGLWPPHRAPKPAALQKEGASRERPGKPGLTFREQRKLNALPAVIEALEAEQHALTQAMCPPEYHRQAPDALKADRERAETIEHDRARKFERWAVLAAKAGEGPPPV